MIGNPDRRNMRSRQIWWHLALAMIFTVAGIIACGGPPADDSVPGDYHRSMFADLDRTMDWVNSQGYRYCNINEDRICLSPDSVLEFQFPKDIDDTDLDDEFQGDLVIWNEGLDTVRIVQYYMTAVDDSNQSYDARLQEPEEYADPGDELRTLTIQANQRVRLPFSISLANSFRRITRIAFNYQTGATGEPTQIAVSYRPSSILDIEDQP